MLNLIHYKEKKQLFSKEIVLQNVEVPNNKNMKKLSPLESVS
jgi:hypothetical protein